MKLATTIAAGLMALAFTNAPVNAQSTVPGQIILKNITTPLVPTSSLRGDREFGGNGPDMDIRVDLSVGRGGRAVFATVNFEARETGGDGSHTKLEPWTFEVWRWKPSDGARLVASIDHPSWGATARSRGTCGGCAGTEDGAFPTIVEGSRHRAVKSVRLIGDTMGD